MPLSYTLGKLAARGLPYAAGAAAHAYRSWTKNRKGTKSFNRRARAPKLNISNGRIRPWPVLPKTLSAGVTKPMVFTYHGTLSSGGTQSVFGVSDSFKLNDIYHPAVGAATDQPLYYDQMAALYNKYRVMAASVRIRWMCADTTRIMTTAAKVSPAGTYLDLLSKSVEYTASMRNTNIIFMSPSGDHTGEMPRKYFSLKDLEGEKWITKGDDYEANINASPSSTPWLTLAVGNLSDTTSTSVQYLVEIVYYTHFFNPRTPSESN